MSADAGFPSMDYQAKCRSANEALGLITRGQRVFIGSACGEPQHLVRRLSELSGQFSDLEIVRLLSQETASLSQIANQSKDARLNLRTMYLGSVCSESLSRRKRFMMPMNMSEIPRLFKSNRLPLNVALIQVSPPDSFGTMSLGVSVDVTRAAALSADLVIAQVNPLMPRVHGRSFLHIRDVDVFVEHEEPLITIGKATPSDAADRIGAHIARLVEDGSTLQIGLDAASQATVKALAGKNDLGIHSQYLTEDIMRLYKMGVITNRRKGINNGKLVATTAIGTGELYDFLNDNPAIDFHPSDYVNDPFVIARNHRMVSMNVVRSIDLTGQVSADAVSNTHFVGISGIPDFVRGSVRSPGGKAILMLPSTTSDGASSIVPSLGEVPVVIPRADIHYIVTEYGYANLFGKSYQERVLALVSIAHPDFRDGLMSEAKAMGLIGTERTLGEAIRGIYPVHLEECMELKGQTVCIRPAKPADERQIQEHYYCLDRNDVVSRFFHEKTVFGREDLKDHYQIDYVKDLTLIGVVGDDDEMGRVIAVGEYLLLYDSNMAEVAFSVHKDYQGRGLGRVFLTKLAAAARENGIAGLRAYTSPSNTGMIRLFNTLPYQVKTQFEGDALALECRFDEDREVDR